MPFLYIASSQRTLNFLHCDSVFAGWFFGITLLLNPPSSSLDTIIYLKLPHAFLTFLFTKVLLHAYSFLSGFIFDLSKCIL